MRRYSVRSRILFGVTAWLLGAATATTGSLLTVSLLGQGITGNSAQLLTQDAVNKALANEAAQGPGAGAQSASPAVTAVGASSRSQPAATASPAATSKSPAPPPATTAAASPASSPAPTSAPPPPSSGGAVLTSAGGEVVATCQGADAYLISWSPLQGYQVGDVIRGPALTARVTFESHAGRETMMVSCSAGVPSATSRGWVGDE
jgi:hypothetical protein